MKYLLVLVVVGFLVWMLTARSRQSKQGGAPREGRNEAPKSMARCAHCGLHLPAADAVVEGSRVYCSESHRRLGPGPTADR